MVVAPSPNLIYTTFTIIYTKFTTISPVFFTPPQVGLVIAGSLACSADITSAAVTVSSLCGSVVRRPTAAVLCPVRRARLMRVSKTGQVLFAAVVDVIRLKHVGKTMVRRRPHQFSQTLNLHGGNQ